MQISFCDFTWQYTFVFHRTWIGFWMLLEEDTPGGGSERAQAQRRVGVERQGKRDSWPSYWVSTEFSCPSWVVCGSVPGWAWLILAACVMGSA